MKLVPLPVAMETVPLPAPAYRCSECGVAAILLEGEIIRPCSHADAGVTANMSAVAYGVGSLLREDSE